MVNASKSTLAILKAPSEMRLETATAAKPNRKLPLGIAITNWLKGPVLISAALIAIALTVLAVSLRNGGLPTFLVLMIEKQVAKGIVDDVQRSEKKKKGLKVVSWIVKHHFTLQNGQTFHGESSSDSNSVKKGEQVDVEYYPKRPQANRIVGMSAHSDTNNASVIGLAILVIGVYGVASGLRERLRTGKLLRSGLLGKATVTHCIEVRSGATYEANGFKWKQKTKRKEIPLIEFQQQVAEAHRIQYDDQGKYIGTFNQRALHVAIAIFFGVPVGGIVGFATTLILFGAPWGWGILGFTIVGAASLASCEVRWRILLRGMATTKASELPQRFKKVKCILQLLPHGYPEPIQLEKELDLNGDASDALPRPLLYLSNDPTNAMFLDAMEFKSSAANDGEQTIVAEDTVKLLTAFLVIVAAAILGPIIAILV